jgi:hypothetical protein
MKRFQSFYAGPRDGDLDHYPAAGQFPAEVLVPVPAAPLIWTPEDQPIIPSLFVAGTYLLTCVCRHHGATIALYRWKRQTGDQSRACRDLTVAELQRLTQIMATHPDLASR